MVADFLDLGPCTLKFLDGLLLLLPGNVQRVVWIDGARPFGGVEEMDLRNFHLDVTSLTRPTFISLGFKVEGFL